MGTYEYSLLKEMQKPVAIFLIATLAISFYGLNKSQRNLDEQAHAYSIDHMFILCKDAQKTVNEMESALNSNGDYTWMWDIIRSGRNNLTFSAFQIERQSKFLSEYYYGEYAAELKERVNYVAENASDAFIDKVMWNRSSTWDQGAFYSSTFKEDFRCEGWDSG